MPLPFRIEELVNDWSSDTENTPCVDEWGLCPVGAITLFYGNYGCGKSRLVTTIAGQAHAAGRPVLLLDLENPPPAVRNIGFQQSLPRDDPRFTWWHGATKRLKADGDAIFEQPADPDAPVVREWLGRNAGAVVCVDSIGRFLARSGIDENATSEVSRKMGEWATAIIGLGGTIIYIHHPNKSGGMRGSIAIPGNCDQVMEVTPKRDPVSLKLTGVELRPEKNRINLNEPMSLRYVDGRFTASGEEKREGFAAL